MAEIEAIEMAEHVIDGILERGAKHLYEQYLLPKVLPYAACSVIEETSHVAQ